MLFALLALSIAFASISLVILDLISRTPARIVADALAAYTSPQAAFAATLRAGAAAITAVLAIYTLLVAVPYGSLLPAFAVGVFLTGLCVDALIGDLLRGIAFERGSKRRGATSPSPDAQRLDEGRE